MLNTLALYINDTDVSDAYRPDAGAIAVTDGLNQPVTCTVSVEQSALPFAINGGELVTVRDKDQIYFDGVIPVENGLACAYSYLDTLANVYRKMLNLNASDYQTVLDFKNFPLLTFYNQTGDAILKALIEMTPLAGLVDYSGFSQAFVMPEYTVTNRKFSNIVQELGQINGYYFSLVTTSITMDEDGNVTRRFAATFRSAFDQPAPFAVDGDAWKYVLSTLQFQARDKPLINKVEIVGGNIPSDDIRVDVFEADGNIGMWQLTQTPFYLQSSDLFDSDFTNLLPVNLDPDVVGSVTLVNPNVFHAGPDYQNTLNINATSQTGAFFFNNSFQSLDQRFSAFQDIIFQNGASVIFGLMKDRSTNNISNVEMGIWFKPDHTIGLVRNGVEVTPISGAPTWQPNVSYFARIKETSQGTYAEVIGGNLSPTRQWLPIRQSAYAATGSFSFVAGGTGPIQVGDQMFVTVGDEAIAPYVLCEEDTSDTSLVHLHYNMMVWLNGMALLTLDYTPSLDFSRFDIASVTQAYPAKITTTVDTDWATGDYVSLEKMAGMAGLNIKGFTLFQYQITQVTPGDKKNWYLNNVDTTGMGPYTSGGWGTKYKPRVLLNAITDGSEYNVPLAVNTDSEGLVQGTCVGFTGGTDAGFDLAPTGTVFYNGILALAGVCNLISIITRDPIGVELSLTRANNINLALASGEAKDLLAAAQKDVILTVGGADEVAELYAAQIVTEGNTAFVSFFDDPDSVPDKGDIIHVAYKYGVPLRVRVQDQASINMVRARSKIPGDDGVREGAPVDVQDKIFDTDSAIRHGKQYLAARSGLFLQGSVNTSTYHTQGSVPRSGQILAFTLPADNIARSEVVTQVVATHVPTITANAQFGCEVTFGKVPDQFLIAPEDPSLNRRATAFTYDIQSVDEIIHMADTEIKLTVL